ncbi:MAG TPA: TetR/AcrR family transcriptional regulator [Pseudonocardiaceae bacterium]|jgi:AcrR family transcriptional regulator
MPEPHAATETRLGRPRSVKAHNAVLTATTELLAEGGYPAATVDAISQRSGVSKATIYKHWPSRTAVAAEAFGIQMATVVQTPHTDDARADLVEQVHLVSAFYSSATGRVFAQLLAACVTDPDGAAYFREYFLAHRRVQIATLWSRAIEAGIARPEVDAEVATDVLFGPLVFRLMSGHADLSDATAAAIADAALAGLLKNLDDDGNAA